MISRSLASPTDTRTARVPVPGAELHVEVRGDGPVLLLHGAPMDARAFQPLADLLSSDHTVVTIDPRGIARSTVDDHRRPVDPDTRAGDVAQVLLTLDAGPAVVFGSSGGAVSALALAASRPEMLAGVIAHEPPLAKLVEDRQRLLAETEQMIATYAAGDRLGYWRLFLASAAIEFPEGAFEAWFGQPPAGRDAKDEQFGVEQMQMATTFWQPPLDTLRDGTVPLTVGIGHESAGQLCDRTARALAHALHQPPTMFPGGHTGFVEQPAEFGQVLRRTLRKIGA